MLKVAWQVRFQASYPVFFFYATHARARAGTQGMVREAQSAQKRGGKAEKGRNRAQTGGIGRKRAEKGPPSRVFMFF